MGNAWNRPIRTMGSYPYTVEEKEVLHGCSKRAALFGLVGGVCGACSALVFGI